MKENKAPYQKMIWVCANVRTDGKIACANEGRQGQEILDALKDKVKELGLKGKVPKGRHRGGSPLGSVPAAIH